MSAPAAFVLGIGLGVFPVSQLVGVGAVWVADKLTDRHWAREGLSTWARRTNGWGD